MGKRTPEYKPLLYTTTMRNPARLKYMLYVLSKYEGRIMSDDLATCICGDTIRYGLYRPTKIPDSVKEKWSSSSKGEFRDYMLTDDEVSIILENNPQKHKEAGFAWGWPSRFATIYDLTKEMGLAYFANNEPIEISELGKHLLASIKIEADETNSVIVAEVCHPEYEQQVFMLAMAKSQRRNPFVRVLNDNVPLVLLLQVICLLKKDIRQNGAGISRRELPLLIFWKDNDSQALYRRIVKLREEYGYNPSDETIVDICINEIMEGNFKSFKVASIVDEYPDEFIRKMRLTGLISMRGAGRFLDINSYEKSKVDYILKNYSNYLHFDDEREYFNYMASVDHRLIKIASQQASINKNENLLKEWLNVYSWSAIKKELVNLSSKSVTTDRVLKLLSAPTRLEFLTALAIKNKLPDVRVIPNYCCDDTGLPTSTAGGNKGDIECFEQKYGILVEVTMAQGRTQTMMEIWPIERHLDDFLKSQEAQCIFVAPSIYSDSKQQINYVAYNSNGEKIIRPYTISELIDYLENYNVLYDNSIKSLSDSSEMVEYTENLLSLYSEMSILDVVKSLISKFGEEYSLMKQKDWYTITREYIIKRTRKYRISDNEPIFWNMAAENLQ